MDTRSIQLALKGVGIDPGPIDGAYGRKTIAALRAYQASQHLDVSGVADKPTLTRLFPDATAPVAPTPPWYAEALRLQGVHEIAGPRSNPTILGWAKAIGGWVAKVYTNDDTAWCGLFVAHLVGSTLPAEPLPANPLSALAWGSFGVALKGPAVGAICVFRRPGGGHVGLYVGEDKARGVIRVLGGNQSDQVGFTNVRRDRLVGLRWPKAFPLPTTGAVSVAATGAISRNEA